MKIEKAFYIFVFLFFINLIYPCLCSYDLSNGRRLSSLEKAKRDLEEKKKRKKKIILNSVLGGIGAAALIGLGVSLGKDSSSGSSSSSKKSSTFSHSFEDDSDIDEGSGFSFSIGYNKVKNPRYVTGIYSTAAGEFITYEEVKNLTLRKLRNQNKFYSTFELSDLLASIGPIESKVRNILSDNGIYMSDGLRNRLVREVYDKLFDEASTYYRFNFYWR